MAVEATADEFVLPEIDFAYEDVPDLHMLIDSVRSIAPIVPIRYWGRRYMLIHRHDLVKRAFLDEEHFPSADAYREHSEPSQGRTIQTMGGEEHRRNRTLVSAPFTPKAVRKIRDEIIEPVVDELLDAIDGKETIDLVKNFTQPLPFRIITRLLDLPVSDEPKFLTWAVKLLDFPWDPEGALKARDEFTTYLSMILDQRRKQPGEDLISQLAQVEIDGQTLDDEAIFSFCRLLFPAGSDTTFKTMGSMFIALLKDDRLRSMSQEDEDSRRRIVRESVRLEPPVPILPRVCSKDIVLGGVSLKKGDPVMFGIAPANRDPAVFKDPHRFDPERGNIGQSLTFGQGEHHCLGRLLALAELEIALKAIFERFPDMSLMPERPPQIVLASLRGPRELWVRPRG